MSIQITIEGADAVDSQLDSLALTVQNPSDGLLEVVNDILLPDLVETSQTVWGVESGDYSSSWEANVIDSDSVEVSNPLEYSAPLEYGWTRGGTTVSSPGVLFPVVDNDLDSLAEALGQWILNQLS